ncbi:MAG: ABC transporter ATP-binding protein [Phycisphaerales bacterium]|nr:MAG: ABC transporter ATP-binding protein [Phycisphaerales bacterium]
MKRRRPPIPKSPLSVHGLSFTYGELRALHNVTVTATPGCITAVLGPNAAGKSTLLRCIIGVEKPKEGEVRLGDRAVRSMHPQDRAARLAYVPQRSTVAASFTVRQVIELGRYALPPDPARIDHAIESCDLVDLVDRPYPALSVGQQQRVTLARALTQLEPGGVIVLDEPTSAMDYRHVDQAMRLIKACADQGATVLIAMHDLGLAADLASEAWLLDEGSLIASGETCEVLNAERLRAVYGVPFRWLNEDGRTWLVPDRRDGSS